MGIKCFNGLRAWQGLRSRTLRRALPYLRHGPLGRLLRSLSNLRTLLDSFTFTDEVQQYARKAALAVAEVQGINISHPLMKALAQKCLGHESDLWAFSRYTTRHGSLEAWNNWRDAMECNLRPVKAETNSFALALLLAKELSVHPSHIMALFHLLQLASCRKPRARGLVEVWSSLFACQGMWPFGSEAHPPWGSKS